MKIRLFLKLFYWLITRFFTRRVMVTDVPNDFKKQDLILSKLLVLAAIFLLPTLAYAQFPYNEDFRTSTQRPDLVFGGSPAAFLTAGKNIDTGTDAEGEGYLRLTNNTNYQKAYVYSNNVFKGTYGLDIEFEYFTHGGNGADGIGFFLFDASANPFNIGAYGGSLGYAQNNDFDGVSKGYLGVGLDEFGNFSNSNEGRSGGPGQRANSVVLRGAGNGKAAGNYEHLITQRTQNFAADADKFNIAGNVRGATAGQDGYRKVFINLKPRVGGGLLITIRIQHGGVTTTIFNNFEYTTPIPTAGLKYGIASSTGAQNNYHEIRGLKITVDPNAVVNPTAVNDADMICQGSISSLDILSNDSRPNSDGAPNPASVDLDPTTAAIEQKIVTAQGTFEFIQSSSRLIFTPSSTFNSVATIQYKFMDIYGAPSNVATVTITTVYPKINSQPTSQVICENGDAAFSVGVDQGTNTGTITYKWEYNTGPGWLALNNGATAFGTVSGALTKDLVIKNIPLTANNVRFRAIVKSSTVNCSATSNDASLRVNAKASVNDVGNQVKCNNAATEAITFGGTNATTFTWTNNTPGIGLAASGIGNIGSFKAINATASPIVATITVTPNNANNCPGPAKTFTITVNPDVSIALTSTSKDRTTCINTAIESITYKVTNGTGATFAGLPQGVIGAYDAATSTVTISGTPIQSGTYNYTVTATGTCASATATGTITVNPSTTITPPSNSNRNPCVNTAITDIDFTATNTTGFSVEGLPAGLTFSSTAGTFKISGIPTATGTFNYTVTANGLCNSPTATGTITVRPDVVIALTSANQNQSICINKAVANITYQVTNGTGATVTGLPTGVIGSYDPGTKIYTISGTASQAGTFNYTVTATGPCASATSTGTIIVMPDVTLSLSSDNNTRIVCVNKAILDITYTATNETNITVSGLPDGVIPTYTAHAFKISGSPTQVGEFTYTVTASGACEPAIATGKIIVNPDVTIALTSSNQEQTVCINRAVTNVTYQVTNGTNATVTGLPAGVTGNYDADANIFTISGTPTQSGVYDFQVTATGNCEPAIINGKITVTPDVTIAIGSANGHQTTCINSGIQDIVFNTANATGATVSGLPTGLTGTFSNGSFRISGTPTQAGEFPYTVTATGPCLAATAGGTITVNPDVTLALTSASADRTLCINTAVTNITYTTANATDVTVSGLPNGVTGTFNTVTNVFTIGGTPTQFGTFNYTVTATGLCQPAVLTGTVIVKPDVTIVLNSANQNQTVCINNGIENIVYTTANETNVTVAGLPIGVTGTYTNGSFVISGIPTESGSFPYTVTATGDCISAIASGIITVNPDVTLNLTSSNKTQTICINTAVADITYAVNNATAVNVSGLPTGITGNFNPTTKVFTISGTARQSGTFNYTVTASGLCKSEELQGTITVNPDVTIVLNSANQDQTVCINNGIGNIVYSVANETNVTVSGLPAGVTGVYTNGSFVISGIPTEFGTFPYTVTATGACAAAIASGKITVNPDVTLVLSSSSADQTLCINTTLTNITYAATHATAATISGLPTGLTGAFNNGTFTISGTPTQSGTFTYTITATRLCKPVSLSGTIKVNPDVVIVLNSANQEQTVCINNGIQNIVYTVTNGNIATVAGLPAGVTGTYTNGTFVISGTPIEHGVFNYTVTATGTCVSAIATGVLTVNPDVELVLSSTSANQTLCINTVLTNITYTATNATAATIIGLPTGLTGTFNNGTFTISGTPTQSGTFDYTVTATGLCVPKSLSGTIIVNPDVVITPNTTNASQTLCVNTPIQTINITLANETNATVTGLPAGVSGVYTNGSFVISGTPTEFGSFPYTVTATGTCVSATTTGILTVNPDVQLVLSSADANQTLCINTVLTNITYTATNATAATIIGLPTGLTGTFNNGTFTISGTPTQSGTFDYTVTATGLCVPKSLSGTIIVNPDVVITPNTTNASQTLCVNTPIQTINITLANETNATVTGLPAGVTGVYTNGSFVISGTPTEFGSFPYTVTATGTCVSATTTGILTVNPDVQLVLSSADANQTLCINTVLTNITYTATNATAATIIGLPTGLTGTFNNGTFTISGTPTQSGTFDYTVTATGLCVPKSLSGKIIVNPDVVITPNTTNASQTLCVNTPIQSINITLANETNATVTGLPAGVTGVYTNGSFVISGTPTEFGTFSYTVTATGTCVSATTTGILTVNPDVQLVLSSADANQTLCINTALTNITYTATNATAATIIGLPTGLTGTFNNGTFTISGTPTQSGTFNYTVTATGLCVPKSLTGTIIVNPDVVITPNTTNASQTLCINTPIQSINITLANETNATVTGLPAGVTGVYTNGSFVISGTPTEFGTFPYSVTATGTCVSATTTGILTVNPDVTVTLTSASLNQEICINRAIIDITFAVTNGTAASVSGLPNGVTGTYNPATKILTISGTPTESGAFTYTVTGTGTCLPASLSGTINVKPDVTIVTNSASADQTICVDNPIQQILFTVAHETNVTVTGLPAGVTGTYTNGSFVISGIPTLAGSYPYIITASGDCVSAILRGTITVNPDVTISLSTANNTQTVCVNRAIVNIGYALTNETGATVAGLPNGVSGVYSNGSFMISGTPTEAGTFPYTVTATGLCKPASLNGIITVKPDATISLSTANNTQTVCINRAIQQVNYTVTNAAGATVTGLPTGVTGTYTNGTFVISGTPTVPGIFNYTITAAGACEAAIATGTITVNPDVSIALASTSKDQTLCINTALQSISYTLTNETNATVTGLPNGLSGTYTNGSFVISGTPTQSGTFPYTITASGLCAPAFATGTITVTPDVTITLNTANSSQSICINTAVQNITYTLANATNVTATNLPAGVTGVYNNGSFVISGTPTIAGTFDYTITATGPCVSAITTGQIVVKPNVTIALTSAAGTSNQAVCLNLPITNIQYTVTNGTGATVSGLPGGVTGTFANGVFTISGSATQSGTFNYTVTTTGGCSMASLSGTLTVAPNVTLTLVSAAGSNNQAVCVNNSFTDIRYQISNGTGATVTGLPAGLTGVYLNGIFTISGTPSQAGTYTYTVNTVGGCASASLSGTLKVNPDATIQLTSAAATANQTVCLNTDITTISYSTTAATGATVTGLPQGLIGTYANGTIVISGKPVQTGTFNYTLTATGLCKPVQMSGTITVNPLPVGFNDLITNLNCDNSRISYPLQDNINNVAKGGNSVASSFSWTIVPNQNIVGLSSGSGNTITATLRNLSHQVQQAVYVVTPISLNGCPGRTFTVTVEVPVCSGIAITKTANVSVVSQAGDQIRYTISVINTGAANHTEVKVNDPFLGGAMTRISGDNGNGILEANETWIYGGTSTLTQADIDNNGKPVNGSGKITNTATVISNEHPAPLSASADVSINSTGDVVLVKTGVMSSDFATITYTFKITNTGNVRLTNLQLMDTKFAGDIRLNATTLEVGASMTATATYTVTDNEKRDGRVMNTATITGTTPAGGTVSDVSGTQANNDDPTLHIIDDAPQAVNDRAETMINKPVTFSITGNDLPSFNGLDAGSVVITTYPKFGTLAINMDGTVTYTPNRTFSGQDSFMYTVTDYKGKLSNRALVNITVTPIDLFIPNTFTPNGDGKNDTFKIVGRESFDTVELLIFNRWGNEVYRNKNYQDEWDGSGLNEGTYYYVLTLKKGADQTSKKGWILLKR